jgi:hypothetical protein
MRWITNTVRWHYKRARSSEYWSFGIVGCLVQAGLLVEANSTGFWLHGFAPFCVLVAALTTAGVEIVRYVRSGNDGRRAKVWLMLFAPCFVALSLYVKPLGFMQGDLPIVGRWWSSTPVHLTTAPHPFDDSTRACINGLRWMGVVFFPGLLFTAIARRAKYALDCARARRSSKDIAPLVITAIPYFIVRCEWADDTFDGGSDLDERESRFNPDGAWRVATARTLALVGLLIEIRAREWLSRRLWAVRHAVRK